MPTRPAVLALCLALASTTLAAPPPRGEPPGPPDKAQREKLLKRVHTMLVVELGELLELDTAGTIKLAERLQKYEQQRTPLRIEMFESMGQLKQLADGKGTGDAAALAKKVASNRVKLAEIDQKELEDILTGLPPDKAAKAAVFLARFPKRIEKMAHEARRGGREGRGGPDDDDR